MKWVANSEGCWWEVDIELFGMSVMDLKVEDVLRYELSRSDERFPSCLLGQVIKAILFWK
jgi:hypothetical protein